MKYFSTRGGGEKVDSAQAIIKGLAEDGGLYIPENMPELPFDIEELQYKDYREIARAVIGSFFDDFTEDEIRQCVSGAYDEKFDSPVIAPVKGAGGAYFLELYHGRTSAFKDMALSILPLLLTTAMKKQGEKSKICILTATSGDTGKAALEGFSNVAGTEIIVFYPEDGVSEIQKRQMITQEGLNTHVFGIKGNFDDAQRGVKEIFSDSALSDELGDKGVRLSSANSINIGRLIPQVAYYFHGYGQMVAQGAIEAGSPINISVPTGNFGNILAAYYAKKMGLPIKTLICASNKNNVLTDFINSGVYDANREFFTTMSPSMDILVSSNLERLLYDLSGGDSGEIKKLMEDLNARNRYVVSDEMKRGLSCFYGGYAEEEETLGAIRKMYRNHGYLMDTHTAVAFKVYEKYSLNTCDAGPTLIASTASPYKFAGVVGKAIGIEPGATDFETMRKLFEETGVEIPAGLKNLEEKEIRHDSVIEIREMAEALEGIL